MYTMLLEEVAWALEEKEPYTFSHYLILSKTYWEVASKLDVEDDRPKKKKRNTDQSRELFYFHPEDEVFQRHAAGYGSFEYTRPVEDGQSDSKRACHPDRGLEVRRSCRSCGGLYEAQIIDMILSENV